MPVPREVDVRHFVKKNDSFFRTPIVNQAEFAQFFSDKGKVDEIQDYSEKLMKVLQKTIHQEGKYNAPAMVWWLKGDFEKVLKEPAIPKFLMDYQNHPALLIWLEDHPPADIPPPPSLSEKEIQWLHKFAGGLNERLEQARTEIQAHIIQLKAIKNPDAQTQKDIAGLKKARVNLDDALKELKSIQEELSGKNGRPLPSEVKSKFETVENTLTVSFKNNILIVENKHVKGWGERLLDWIAKAVGFEGYQSDATKRGQSISKLAQQLPSAMQNTVLKMTEFKTKTREIRKADEDPPTSVQNNDPNLPFSQST